MFVVAFSVGLLLLFVAAVYASCRKKKRRETLSVAPLTPMGRRVFRLKGLYYRTPSEQQRAVCLQKDETLVLEPEPHNAHDPYAIRVLTDDGVHIGYVPRELSQSWRGTVPASGCGKVLRVCAGPSLPQVDIEVGPPATSWHALAHRLQSAAVLDGYAARYDDVARALQLENTSPSMCVEAWKACAGAHKGDAVIEYRYLLSLGYAHYAAQAAQYAAEFMDRYGLHEWKDLADYERHWREELSG